MVAHILLPSKLKGPPWRELNSTVPNDFLTGSLPSGGEVKMEARLEYLEKHGARVKHTTQSVKIHFLTLYM